ncbi:MAG: hypothetical protein ACREQR_07785 [Candidatus Binataceae bacterium]
MMIRKSTITITFALAAMMLFTAEISARAADIKIGVGALGPISPQAENDIEKLVGQMPNVDSVPIQPPGDVDACVKRFVAGDLDDRLDAVIVVSLPTDSFKVVQTGSEAKFTGSYQIWTLNLSTLAEDRHTFTFTDSETIVSGPAAILSIPAQFLFERTSGQRMISSSTWQAYESIQVRVEAKLVAATKLYLSTSSLGSTQPLNLLQCAQALVNRGDADTALAVFQAAGADNPQVRQMMADAREKMRRAKAEGMLGRALGAIAGGNSAAATTILAEYQKEPTAEPARAEQLRRALAVETDHRADTAYHQLLLSDVPGLDRAAFVAMLTQMMADATGSAPEEVVLSDKDVSIEDKRANDGLKTALDRYATALGKAAWLMSIKCRCDAGARLTVEPAGQALLRASFSPSFTKPQVGLP